MRRALTITLLLCLPLVVGLTPRQHRILGQVAASRSVASVARPYALWNTNGGSGYIDTTYTPNFMPRSNAWTFACWIKLLENTTTVQAFAGTAIGSNQRFYLAVDGSDSDKWLLNTFDGTLADSIYSSNSATFEVWQLFAVSCNGTGVVQMSTNSIVVRTAALPTSFTTTGSFDLLAVSGGIIPISAAIDEVAFWRRQLQTAELAELYASGVGVHIATTNTFSSTGISMGENLSALWHLNEGGGTIISESSGNNYTGTMINAFWTNGIVPLP